MSKVKSLDYIVTAKHYSESVKADGTVAGYHRRVCQLIKERRGVVVSIVDPETTTGDPVYARIWQGQWIADCPCNGAEFVAPDEPVFFCFGCGNRANNGRLRPVIFPPENERLEIERLVLDRPVDDMAGLSDLERAGLAKPLIVVAVELDGGTIEHRRLGRDWLPGESLEDLQEQNAPVQTWRKLSLAERSLPIASKKNETEGTK